MSYLNCTVAFQFHDVDSVIYPLSILVKLYVPSKTVNSHLHQMTFFRCFPLVLGQCLLFLKDLHVLDHRLCWHGDSSPVLGLVLSPPPVPTEQRDWPDSLHCLLYGRCQFAACAGSGRPQSSLELHHRSVLKYTGQRKGNSG